MTTGAAHAYTIACALTPTPVITVDAPRTIADLTGAVSRGDACAFEVLYREWFPRCVGMARARTGRDESFCLDVAQDVMLKAARCMPALGSEDDLRRWLMRAVLTGAIDALRKESRGRRRERRAAGEVRGGASPVESGALAEQLAALGPEDRWLVLHRFAHGLEMATIGRLVGISADAAAGRVRRAVKKMRGTGDGDA